MREIVTVAISIFVVGFVFFKLKLYSNNNRLPPWLTALLSLFAIVALARFLMGQKM